MKHERDVTPFDNRNPAARAILRDLRKRRGRLRPLSSVGFVRRIQIALRRRWMERFECVWSIQGCRFTGCRLPFCPKFHATKAGPETCRSLREFGL